MFIYVSIANASTVKGVNMIPPYSMYVLLHMPNLSTYIIYVTLYIESEILTLLHDIIDDY